MELVATSDRGATLKSRKRTAERLFDRSETAYFSPRFSMILSHSNFADGALVLNHAVEAPVVGVAGGIIRPRPVTRYWGRTSDSGFEF